MGFGLITGDAGTIQASDVYPSVALVAKSSLGLSAVQGDETGSLQGATGATLDINAVTPVLAFACPQRALIRTIQNTGSNAWRFSFLSKGGSSLSWWLYDFAYGYAPAPNDYGLRLRDAYGRITFQDTQNQARIVAAIAAQGTLNLDGSRAYAVAQTGLGGHRDRTVDPDAGTTDLITLNGCSVNGGQVVAQYDTYRQTYLRNAKGPAQETTSDSYGGFVVLDVTGH